MKSHLIVNDDVLHKAQIIVVISSLDNVHCGRYNVLITLLLSITVTKSFIAEELDFNKFVLKSKCFSDR